jgi:hypothetical protein
MYHYTIGSGVSFSGKLGGVIKIILSAKFVSVFKLFKEKENS